MKRVIVALMLVCAAGCSSKPCVDGERTSNSWGYMFGSTRNAYDPCPQKCCGEGWTRGCACTKRCPCWERHPKELGTK